MRKKKLTGLGIWNTICICRKRQEGASYNDIEKELEKVCEKEYNTEGMFGCISKKDIVSKVLVIVLKECCNKKQMDEFVSSLCRTENRVDFYTGIEHRLIDFIGNLEMACYNIAERQVQ